MRTCIRPILLSVVFLFSTYSCDKEKTNAECGISDPLHEIDWLASIKEEMTGAGTPARIVRYTYDGECVFVIDRCYQCPDALSVCYTNDGVAICEFGGIDGRNTCPGFEDDATDRKVLFEIGIP